MAQRPASSESLLPRTGAGPKAPSFPVVRTRLIEHLQADLRFTILTLIAPPGYGKTVTLGELFRAELADGRAAIWVTPRPGMRLAPMLADAVGCGQHCDEKDAIAELQGWMDELKSPLSIFVDRLEAFDGISHTGWLDRLLGESPEGLRWLFGSRSAVPIDRIHHLLEGRLREATYSDLSFSPRETRELLGDSVCQHLEPQDFDFLHETAEGWPAALRIIGERLAVSEHPRSLLRTFAEPQPDFANYFDTRLLAHLSDDERTLMFELALLPEVDPGLCVHVSHVEEPLVRLARLQQCNRVAQAPDGSSALRLHPLIAIHCRARAQLRLNEAHRRQILTTAGAWYEARGQWDRAIEVRLLADDCAQVVKLLEQHCELLARDQGQLLAVIRWVEALQSREILPGPRAHFWYVWALVFGRRYGFAERKIGALVRHLEATIQADDASDESVRLLSQVQVIKACIAIYFDRIEETHELASGWLAGNSDGDPFHVGESHGLVTLAHLDACRFAEARRSLGNAHAALVQSGSRYGLGWMQMFEGLISLREGDVGTARDQLRSYMESLRADLGDDVPLLASMELVCARCSMDQGLEEEAENLLLSGLRVAQAHGHLDPLVCGVDVGVALWMGGNQESNQIQQLQGLANSYPSRLSLMLNCYLVLALLRLERLTEARELAFELGLDPDHSLPRFELEELARDGMCRQLYAATHIRLMIAFSALERATKKLTVEIASARDQNRIADLVSLHLDAMVINLRSAQGQKARQSLTRAVCLAARRKLLRPFRERLDNIAPLVLNTRPGEWGWAETEEKQFFGVICRDLPMESEQLRDALEEVGVQPELAAAITHREIEFLKLIDLGLSNAQIATRCELSISTVKWHLYNLFGKLGAKSRAAAVVQARALNLIS